MLIFEIIGVCIFMESVEKTDILEYLFFESKALNIIVCCGIKSLIHILSDKQFMLSHSPDIVFSKKIFLSIATSRPAFELDAFEYFHSKEWFPASILKENNSNDFSPEILSIIFPSTIKLKIPLFSSESTLHSKFIVDGLYILTVHLIDVAAPAGSELGDSIQP